MSMIWAAILACVLAREGQPDPPTAASPRPAVGERSPTRCPVTTPRLVFKRHGRPWRIAPDSNNPADDSFDDDIFDEEDGEESWTIDLDLESLDLRAGFDWNRPPSDGALGRLPSTDPTPRAPLHLRC